MASEVPPEILTEILYRLPTKSVGRFRRFKDWLSQLSSPQFINQNQIIFVSYYDFSVYSLQLIDHHEKTVLIPTKLHVNSRYVNFINFCGSCNGLVLVSSWDFQQNYQLVILNPMTREFTELPEYSYKAMDKITLMIGFGHDSLTDDYKVIHFHCPIPHFCIYVNAYSLRTNTWKPVIDSPYNYSLGKSFSGVFVYGFLHWFAKRHSDGSGVILAFSLAYEKFNEVPSPDVVMVAKDGCQLVVLGGKLAIFLNFVAEVWLMNEYGVKESWTKILLQGLHEYPMSTIFYKNGKIWVVGDNQMLIYDIEGRRFSNNIAIFDTMQMTSQGSYVESLVSPKLTRNN